MMYLLLAISVIGIFFTLRYIFLIVNLRKARNQLEEIKQNPDENRILLFSAYEKSAEKLLTSMNEYILSSRKERIFYRNREKKLRAQIENISHDLRTPLTSILGYLDLIDKEELNTEDRESLEVVERKAKTLQNLISNFYDLSRLELEDYHLSMEPVNLARFTRETMLQAYSEFEQKNLLVNVDVKEATIPGDLIALTRIFHNMNQNALRYATGIYRVSVEKQAVRKEEGILGKATGWDNSNHVEEYAVLTFENDCTSLKEEDLEHLFERFYVKDQSRTSESTGLGLTINKLLAEAMGGSVRAELAEGRLRILYTFPIISC